jgi:hypothetical protein
MTVGAAIVAVRPAYIAVRSRPAVCQDPLSAKTQD